MAKLEITLTKEKYDALSDELKTFYTATQDGGFELEGIGSIQRALETERKSTTKQEMQDELISLRKFKADQEAAKSADDDAKAKEAGKFEELEQKLRDKIAELEGKVTDTDAEWRSFYLGEKVKNTLAEKGLRPERTKYALLDVQDQFELDEHRNLKVKNGIGDAKEIDGLLAKLRESTPDFFTPQTQTGGGATGSGNNSGQSTSEMTAQQKLDTLYSK